MTILRIGGSRGRVASLIAAEVLSVLLAGVFFAGLLSLAVVRPPDVLVSGDAKLLGVRDDQGELWVSSGRTARYAAETWARRAGVARPRVWSAEGPDAAAQAHGQLRCDGLGCLFRGRGQLVALVNDSRALAEDCAEATVVIALVPVPDGVCQSAAGDRSFRSLAQRRLCGVAFAGRR